MYLTPCTVHKNILHKLKNWLLSRNISFIYYEIFFNIIILYYNSSKLFTDSNRNRTRSGASIKDHACIRHSMKDQTLHHSSERIIQSVNEVTVLETTSAANDSINKIDTSLM